MKHQFHLVAFVICLALWLGSGPALAIPLPLVQSELSIASYENLQILNRVSYQLTVYSTTYDYLNNQN